MNKVNIFTKELLTISDEQVRQVGMVIINNLPDYFFEIPASSTGKYHPEFSLGYGGLVRHSKVVFKIGLELLNTTTFGNDYTDREKSLILLSLLVHDGLKNGLNYDRYTRFDHPILMSEHLSNLSDKLLEFITEEELNLMKSVIETHMGQWNKTPYSETVLELPTTNVQKLVHLCDLLGSRKWLNVSFDGNDNIVE